MMTLKINGVDLPKMPSSFSVTISDLDDGTTTTRTMDGKLHRDRIAVKRKLELKFNAMSWSELSMILQMIEDIFFDVTYPDSQTGTLETKEFYVGNRTSPIALFRPNGDVIWNNIAFNFIER